jgi:hypothetical protein
LEPNEKRERAVYLFPGLISKDETQRRHISTLEQELYSRLNSKLILLKEDETETNWDRLMELNNVVELCIKLGLNPEVVHKRQKVVNNLKKELNLESKTPTITTIRHLIKSFESTTNPLVKRRI